MDKISTDLVTESYREGLFELLRKHSFMYDPNGGFRLNCGAMSKFYFNCKKTTLLPAGQYNIGNLFMNLIEERFLRQIDGVGGLTLGADAIATAIANKSYIRSNYINAFIVRKTAKEYGTKQKIEGQVSEGMHVIVLDDVITTGGSTIQSIKACKENGLVVRAAMVLVDREELNGRQNILEYVPEVISIFSASDFLE